MSAQKQSGSKATSTKKDGLYIVMLSIHGLVRGRNIELGRDADTGGQVKYVVELAEALSRRPEVERVDIMTRRVAGKNIDPIYSQPEEKITDKAYIVRIPCGPKHYMNKEKLWPYVDGFADEAMQHICQVNRTPDIVHGHYSESGYIGSKLASLLGVPFVFTGHSLGRVKFQRLMDNGERREDLEKRYHLSQRIEAEEVALDNANFVVASTHQEVEDQYAAYEHYQPGRMRVIPPGVDLSRFSAPKGDEGQTSIVREINRFLREPGKPLIMAMARPDDRKNFNALVHAYGQSKELQEKANLLLIMGNRDEVNELDPASRKVVLGIMNLIDRYDLYGKVSYPKHHKSDEGSTMYRYTSMTGGVFVNPALTEPFGLTLIEAAASGVPIVATNDGGPRDIIGHCENGFLVDPLKPEDIASALLKTLSSKNDWKKWSKNGMDGVYKYYSWDAHATRYLDQLKIAFEEFDEKISPVDRRYRKTRLPTYERVLVTDIDGTLIGGDELPDGDDGGLRELIDRLDNVGERIGFGIATGRNRKDALNVLEEYGIPMPDILVCSVGTEIYYGQSLVMDKRWQQHIDYWWDPDGIRKALNGVKGITLQEAENQMPYKLCFYYDPEVGPDKNGIVRILRQNGIRARVILSHGMFLDIVPIRGTDGMAIRSLAIRLNLDPDSLLVAGDSGNDEDMLTGNTLGVVVGNYSNELEHLRGRPRIYFAEATHARGVLEGIDHYNFFGDINIPEEEEIANE